MTAWALKVSTIPLECSPPLSIYKQYDQSWEGDPGYRGLYRDLLSVRSVV